MSFLSLCVACAVLAASGSAQPYHPPSTVEFEGMAGSQTPAPEGSPELAYAPDDADRMTVPVRLGDAGPFNFLIDTGADRTVVSRSVANRLKLGGKDRALLHSVTGTQRVETASIQTLRFSAKTIRNVEAAVLDGRNIGADGILGIDSLRSERVTFDFTKGTMTIVPSQVRPERLQKDEVVVRGKLRSGRLVLTQAKAGGRRMNVVIDTGADVSVGNEPLYRMLRKTGLLRPLGKVQLQSVTGELLPGDMMTLDRFEVGGVIVKELNIVFADAHTFRTLKLEDKPALLMGMNTLKAFEKVSIDFANRKFRVLVPEESSLGPTLLAAR